MHKISIRTRTRVDFQDITAEIQNIVNDTGIKSGVCHVYVPHTTAGITINEHADPSVVEDITSQLDSIVPQHTKYRHLEGNSPAHIKASLMGSAQTVFIDGGKLVLGTWQGIFFCEFDGPRNRSVIVKVVPDKS